MDKNKLAKIAVKAVIGFGVSALIGATIKTESKLADAIDTYFKNQTESAE